MDIALSFKYQYFMKTNLRTFIKHNAKDFYNQSVNPPVVRASTIIFKNILAKHFLHPMKYILDFTAGKRVKEFDRKCKSIYKRFMAFLF